MRVVRWRWRRTRVPPPIDIISKVSRSPSRSSLGCWNGGASSAVRLPDRYPLRHLDSSADKTDVDCVPPGREVLFSQRQSLHPDPCWVRIGCHSSPSSAGFSSLLVFVCALPFGASRTVLFGVEEVGHFSSAPHRWSGSLFSCDSVVRILRGSIPAELGADPRRIPSLSLSFSPLFSPPSAKSLPYPWRTSRRRSYPPPHPSLRSSFLLSFGFERAPFYPRSDQASCFPSILLPRRKGGPRAPGGGTPTS